MDLLEIKGWWDGLRRSTRWSLRHDDPEDEVGQEDGDRDRQKQQEDENDSHHHWIQVRLGGNSTTYPGDDLVVRRSHESHVVFLS